MFLGRKIAHVPACVVINSSCVSLFQEVVNVMVDRSFRFGESVYLGQLFWWGLIFVGCRPDKGVHVHVRPYFSRLGT